MRNPLTLATLALLAALAPLSVGCQSTYRDKGNFIPHPADVSTAQEPRIRTLASVVGIRNPDKEAGLPTRTVEVRLQIENRGGDAVTFDPATLRLTAGDLAAFGRPTTTPADPQTIPAGGAATVTANFPFPEGVKESKVDLNGLNLEWSVAADGERATQSATFTRRLTDEQRHRDSGPHFGIGIGTVIR